MSVTEQRVLEVIEAIGYPVTPKVIRERGQLPHQLEIIDSTLRSLCREKKVWQKPVDGYRVYGLPGMTTAQIPKPEAVKPKEKKPRSTPTKGNGEEKDLSPTEQQVMGLFFFVNAKGEGLTKKQIQESTGLVSTRVDQSLNRLRFHFQYLEARQNKGHCPTAAGIIYMSKHPELRPQDGAKDKPETENKVPEKSTKESETKTNPVVTPFTAPAETKDKDWLDPPDEYYQALDRLGRYWAETHPEQFTKQIPAAPVAPMEDYNRKLDMLVTFADFSNENNKNLFLAIIADLERLQQLSKEPKKREGND